MLYTETMSVLLFFAFISGLVTIFAPCIWPLLPIILSSTTTGGKSKPLGITIGITLSFAFFTLSLSYILKIIPFDPDSLRIFAAFIIGILGLTLLIPKFSSTLEGFVSRLSSRFSPVSSGGSGFLSGFITGFSLGIIWSPCAGPILATIAALAATQRVSFQVILVTIAYVIGVGIPLFIFTKGGAYLFQKSRVLSPFTGRIQQIFGIIMIITAFAIVRGYDKTIEVNLLNSIPSYSNFLYKLEGQKTVSDQLSKLKQNKPMPSPSNLIFPSLSSSSALPDLGKAPDFTGITNWLNSKPLTMNDLKGKVVLVDFWTYTCINCIRTLPFVTSWYEKYKNDGFVVVGVHTPEFEFEKKTDNVQNAIKQYGIHYPVAQDNNYQTWNAYNNQYWPAEYLIDTQGNIRHVHFGEGEYDQTEKDIQELLTEAGKDGKGALTNLSDQTPKTQITPETYLGLARMERFSSQESAKIGLNTYTPSQDLQTNYFSFGGKWDLEDQFAQAEGNSILDFKFQAAKVFLVITPQTKSDVIKVSIDGKNYGAITATEAKLYTMVNLDQTSTHILHLDFQTQGTKIFAFTFGD